MTLTIPFDNSFAGLPNTFYSAQNPTPVSAPYMIAFNENLAQLLRVEPGDLADMAQIFSGNAVPDGADPLAQLYAGHQFGNYNPQLGDGRAVLLGETVGTDGIRRDIQLKGSGPTPYSRMGDGRAWLGPVLREYVISEAMHALGIPTTRALVAVGTGDTVYRDTGAMPGAVLTRVAQSHLRVGSFQVFAHRGQIAPLTQLTNYAIARHYPEADGPMGLLEAVCDAQAALIPAWMSVGFIHGVMNTDNCTISGETIDYGPCAFMDNFDQGRVFSSIDAHGRYAYGNQPGIAVWNMAQFATALLQQMDNKEAALEQATAIVHAMPDRIEAHWLTRFGQKIGLVDAKTDDRALIDDLLALMQKDGADFTNTFAALGTDTARDQFVDRDGFDAWEKDWMARLQSEPDAQKTMARCNPQVIPRNHRIEDMISHAVAGDYEPLERLNKALKTPYTSTDPDLHSAPTTQQIVPATFCGT
ncbi:protein adenylyltransferase SelO [Ascidiaceihabitans sp.]|uniref:protein adenylyltransferase SelO n=1 Tax=Ascidiaceihabitans sp. TaxID=1872644 RepID=UPI003297AE26